MLWRGDGPSEGGWQVKAGVGLCNGERAQGGAGNKGRWDGGRGGDGGCRDVREREGKNLYGIFV